MGTRLVQFGCAALMLLASTATAFGQSAEQAQMAQRVAAALKQSGQLSGYSVGVKYQDGIAWLVGSVADEQQHAAAVAVAEQVPGIDRVISKLTIDGPVQPTAESAETEPSLLYDSLQQSLNSIEVEPASSNVASRATPVATPQPLRQPVARNARPLPVSNRQAHAIRMASAAHGGAMPAQFNGGGVPQGYVPAGGGRQVSYDNAHLPGYAWPSYAAHPNYAALTYPKQYSPTAWPYIGPFYPYPQVPLGWRKVTLEWDDGWWMLDFSHKKMQ